MSGAAVRVTLAIAAISVVTPVFTPVEARAQLFGLDVGSGWGDSHVIEIGAVVRWQAPPAPAWLGPFRFGVGLAMVERGLKPDHEWRAGKTKVFRVVPPPDTQVDPDVGGTSTQLGWWARLEWVSALPIPLGASLYRDARTSDFGASLFVLLPVTAGFAVMVEGREDFGPTLGLHLGVRVRWRP